ncbi:MAG: aldo/keto reductase, partial [Desulfobulbaceae bacterium]|nr:aldo/keto reductase [Desulfobulbaceae bacterium]
MFKEDFDDSINIEEYLYIFYKRKILILSIFLVVLAAALFVTFRAIPIYQSTATMIIDKEQSSSPLIGQRTEYESMYSQELTFNTHFQLILSKEVIWRVVDFLGLDDPAAEDKSLEINPIKKWLKGVKKNLKSLLGRDKKTVPTESEKNNSLVNAVRGKVSTDVVEETRLLKISVKDKNPEQAALIANTL